MLNTIVESMFKDCKPMNKPSITVKVEMEASNMMEALAKATVAEVERIASNAGLVSALNLDANEELAPLSEENVLKAFKTLVWLRVNAVTHDGGKSVMSYHNIQKHFACPVLMYQLLIPMGRAYDQDYSIEFIPEVSVDGDDLLSPQEMRAISDVFRRLENHGFKVVYGIPVSEEGELEFMAMAHVEDAVLSYRTKDHPVYAFLASFFKQQRLNEITGTMCRILYGYESDFEYYIDRLLTSINAG